MRIALQYVLLACLTVLGPAHGCSVPVGQTPPPRISTLDIFKRAPLVLSGRFDKEDRLTGKGYFSPRCAFKDGGLEIPSNITVLDAFRRHSCHGTHPRVGEIYIIALKPKDTSTNELFYIYEPGQLNVAALPGDDEENLQKVADLCLSSSVKNPAGTNFKCPTPSAGTCSVSSTVSPSPTPTSRASRVYQISVKWVSLVSLILIMYTQMNEH